VIDGRSFAEDMGVSFGGCLVFYMEYGCLHGHNYVFLIRNRVLTFGVVKNIWHFLEIGVERVRLRVVADAIYNLLNSFGLPS
jgi:hypothetical protein